MYMQGQKTMENGDNIIVIIIFDREISENRVF